MPSKAVVAPEIQTALLYAHCFQLDTEEWGFYDQKGRSDKQFDRIVWLCDENGFRDEGKKSYSHWVNRLSPNGQLHILSIR